MEYVRLGSSGLKVSRICLGMMSYGRPDPSEPWLLNEEAATPLVQAAIEGGVTFFDTADMYSNGASEQITGSLLKQLFSSRDDYVLATKVYYPMGPGANGGGLSRKHILAGIDDSLRRLGTDYVDLYQIHRWDHATPIEETMAALNDVVRAGKARYIGASATYAWQFSKAQYTAEIGGWTKFISMQDRYNVAYREEEREMIPLCLDQGVGILAYSPLARGLLAGNQERGGQRHTVRALAESDKAAELLPQESDFDVVDVVTAVANEREVSRAQVAIGWLLQQPAVCAPIVGATRLAHVREAVAAVELSLSEPEMRRLEAQYRPHPVLGHS